MARTTAVVRDQVLTLFVAGHEQRIEVDSPAWYAWLEEASTFAFEGSMGTFTARKERKRQGRFYWRAYRKSNGTLRHRYLGRSVDLTIDRLQIVAAALAARNDGSSLHGMQPTTERSRRHPEHIRETTEHEEENFRQEHVNERSRSLGAVPLRAHPSTLPLSPTALIGREQETATLLSLLARLDVRLITLTGTGGVGKTRLALEVARVAVADFSDGAFFVPLASLKHPDQVMQAIAQELGLWEAGGRLLVEHVQDVLRDKHLLLLVDNFEQVIEAGPQLASLLVRCPHLKILVTSRAALHLSFEYEFRVFPLMVPDLRHQYTEEDLRQMASVRLFIERIEPYLPTLQLTQDDLRTISEICAQLDGLPLAIELAAARIKLLPLQALLKRLSRRLTILTNGARDLPGRQQTLRNTIQWSYDLLDRNEQRLFRLLSIFVGGCTVEAAAAAMGTLDQLEDTGISQDGNVLDICASLVEKHLIQQTMWQGEEPRFLMLETIREYGLERLQADGELPVVQHAHATYYLQFAVDAYAYLFRAEGVRWFQRLEQEYANLRAAMLWALEREKGGVEDGIEFAVQLSSVLWRFWTVRGHLSEGRTIVERMLSASERSGDETRKKVLLTLGTILWYQNDFAQMKELITEQLHLCQTLGDQQGIAHTLIGLSGLARHQHDYRRAYSLAEQSLAISRTLGDSWRAAVALSLLGRLASARGEHHRACQLLEESIEIYRWLGYPGDIAWPLMYLARDAIAQAEHERARALLEEALALSRKADDKWGLAMSLSFLGQEMLEQGELPRARTLLSECYLLNQELGNVRSVAWSCFLLASVLTLQEEATDARSLFEQGLATAAALAHTRLMYSCLQGLATVMIAEKQLYPAVRLWGSTESLRLDISQSLSLPLRARVEQAQAMARKQMGHATFAQVLAQGRVMKFEQILLQESVEISTPLSRSEVPTESIQSTPKVFARLTARELEVLRLIAQGLPDAQVAIHLFISPRTVTTHLTSIYTKLGVRSRVAATRFAIDHRLL